MEGDSSQRRNVIGRDSLRRIPPKILKKTAIPLKCGIVFVIILDDTQEETRVEVLKKNIQKYKEIMKVIQSYDTIVVYRHTFPDFDASGTQNGLITWLKDSFPGKKVYAAGKDFLDFTPALFPHIEPVDEAGLGKFLAIVVDTGNTKRIDGDGYLKADKIVKFDHHPDVETFADISVVNDELVSCAELVLDFALYFEKKYPLSLLAAKYFYTGIVGDSGRFLFATTSMHTFDAARACLATGLDINRDVYLKMYEKDIQDLEVQKYLLNHYTVSEHGVAYYVLKAKELEALGLRVEQAKIHISLFSNIRGIGIWVSVSEDTEKSEFRVSIRSKQVAINGVAAKYRGGGHDQASGATLKSLDELPDLIRDLDDLLI